MGLVFFSFNNLYFINIFYFKNSFTNFTPSQMLLIHNINSPTPKKGSIIWVGGYYSKQTQSPLHNPFERNYPRKQALKLFQNHLRQKTLEGNTAITKELNRIYTCSLTSSRIYLQCQCIDKHTHWSQPGNDLKCHAEAIREYLVNHITYPTRLLQKIASQVMSFLQKDVNIAQHNNKRLLSLTGMLRRSEKRAGKISFLVALDDKQAFARRFYQLGIVKDVSKTRLTLVSPWFCGVTLELIIAHKDDFGRMLATTTASPQVNATFLAKTTKLGWVYTKDGIRAGGQCKQVSSKWIVKPHITDPVLPPRFIEESDFFDFMGLAYHPPSDWNKYLSNNQEI